MEDSLMPSMLMLATKHPPNPGAQDAPSLEFRVFAVVELIVLAKELLAICVAEEECSRRQNHIVAGIARLT